MFGYVQPLKPELKMKEYEAFRGYYCGLCKSIKEKYTHAARFMLNYDCAVLSLLLSSMSDEVPEVKRERCIASPFKKKTVVRSKESAYAATVNVLLGYGKIKDTAADDYKVSAHTLALLYKGVLKRAAKDTPDLAAEFDRRIANLHDLEMRKSDSVDAVASEFGHLLAAVFSLAPYRFIDNMAKKALWHLGYNLGRWIYIADAVDDLIKDHKVHRYNVYLQRKFSDVANLKEEIRDEAAFNLKFTLAEACKAYELLNITRDKPLLDNIMYLGLAKKTEDILKGEVNGSV
ncbi:MAG: DUF5685 family protein [Christensenellales bacterium]